MTFSDDFTIGSMQELTDLIDQVGFVPFFMNEIEGFSIEEHIADGCWYDDANENFWPAWEWKGPVIRHMKCAYGKFLRGKAMYVSAEWFPDFANFRRDGYDFDARYDDGLASFYDKELFELLQENEPVLSKRLKQIGDYGKGGKKGFDTMITRLQKLCYVLTGDFQYATDRYGNAYGWGIAVYETPEHFFGSQFGRKVYRRTPEESYARIVKQFQKILPDAGTEQIRRILR
ncbi:MAG: hypothetical protein J5518_09910 [Lachnospiraceae bacterium]|nr:hypothetical protein [Lachnospiraceae bacterium]